MRAIGRSAMALLLCGIAIAAGCARGHTTPQCGGAQDACDEEGAPLGGACLRDRPPPGSLKDLDRPVKYVSEPIPPEERNRSTPPLLLDAPLTFEGVPVVHAFPAEQKLLAAVPFYFELPEGTDVAAATLHYKPFGGLKYEKATMSRLGKGFAVVVPCERVQVTGDLRYFVRLLDADGGAVDSLGSRAAPLRVAIRLELQGGTPALPGKTPERCRAVN